MLMDTSGVTPIFSGVLNLVWHIDDDNYEAHLRTTAHAPGIAPSELAVSTNPDDHVKIDNVLAQSFGVEPSVARESWKHVLNWFTQYASTYLYHVELFANRDTTRVGDPDVATVLGVPQRTWRSFDAEMSLGDGSDVHEMAKLWLELHDVMHPGDHARTLSRVPLTKSQREMMAWYSDPVTVASFAHGAFDVKAFGHSEVRYFYLESHNHPAVRSDEPITWDYIDTEVSDALGISLGSARKVWTEVIDRFAVYEQTKREASCEFRFYLTNPFSEERMFEGMAVMLSDDTLSVTADDLRQFLNEYKRSGDVDMADVNAVASAWMDYKGFVNPYLYTDSLVSVPKETSVGWG
jgi:hypothetical protein